MVLTRAQNQPGPTASRRRRSADDSADDVQDANNTDTPWVDQSQTYTSHAVAPGLPARVHDLVGSGDNAGRRPASCSAASSTTTAPLHPRGVDCYNDGNATDGSISTWAAVKKQAAREARPAAAGQGRDQHPDAGHRPVRRVHPGPARAAAVRDRQSGPASRATSPTRCRCRPNVVHFDTPFLTDIAHNADPSAQDTDNNPARRRWHRSRTPTTPRRPTSRTSPPARTTTRC